MPLDKTWVKFPFEALICWLTGSGQPKLFVDLSDVLTACSEKGNIGFVISNETFPFWS